MNRVRKLLIKFKLVKPLPHEKAELGIAPWGRQGAIAQMKATISMRVIRADGTVEEVK